MSPIVPMAVCSISLQASIFRPMPIAGSLISTASPSAVCCTELRSSRLKVSQRQWRAGLQRLDRDIAADLAHHRQVQQLADEKLLVRAEVGDDDFEQIVRLAGNEVAGDDL